MKDIDALKLRLGARIDYQQFELDALAPLKIVKPPGPRAPLAASNDVASAEASPAPVGSGPAGFGRYAEKPADPPPSAAGTSLIDLFRRLESHAR